MAFAIEENKCLSELGDYVVDYQRHGDGAQRVWKSGVVELWGFEEQQVDFLHNTFLGEIQPTLYNKEGGEQSYLIDFANITLDLPFVSVDVYNTYPQIQFTAWSIEQLEEPSGIKQVGYYIKGRLDI